MAKISKDFVGACLELSDDEHSKISQREKELFGLSSSRLRCLLNNLCSKEDVKYLEIGVYRGATLLSALYGNPTCKAVGIDNFKHDPREPKKFAAEGDLWHNVKSQLEDNIRRYRNENSGVEIDNIELKTASFQDIEWENNTRFDVCFFDVTPVNASVYDDFFEKVLPVLSFNSVVVFSNQSNYNHSIELKEALERHKDKLEIEWQFDRVSGGMSDSTRYYSGLAIVGLRKVLAKPKTAQPNKISEGKNG